MSKSLPYAILTSSAVTSTYARLTKGLSEMTPSYAGNATLHSVVGQLPKLYALGTGSVPLKVSNPRRLPLLHSLKVHASPSLASLGGLAVAYQLEQSGVSPVAANMVGDCMSLELSKTLGFNPAAKPSSSSFNCRSIVKSVVSKGVKAGSQGMKAGIRGAAASLFFKLASDAVDCGVNTLTTGFSPNI